jgi:hypothetical protein
VQLAVRSDRITLMPPPVAEGGPVNRIAASVTAVEYSGPFVRVALVDHSANAHSLMLSEADFFTRPVALGDQVIAGFAPADAHLLST